MINNVPFVQWSVNQMAPNLRVKSLVIEWWGGQVTEEYVYAS